MSVGPGSLAQKPARANLLSYSLRSLAARNFTLGMAEPQSLSPANHKKSAPRKGARSDEANPLAKLMYGPDFQRTGGRLEASVRPPPHRLPGGPQTT